MRIYECNGNKEVRETSGYMTILYHNKGIDMVNIPRVLNSKYYVRDAVPSLVHNATSSIVSFKYTKTIAGKPFNHKKTIEDLDVNIGTSNMSCDCPTSKYCYGPAGHVITGDLNVIKDAKLQFLIGKGLLIENRIILTGK